MKPDYRNITVEQIDAELARRKAQGTQKKSPGSQTLNQLYPIQEALSRRKPWEEAKKQLPYVAPAFGAGLTEGLTDLAMKPFGKEGVDVTQGSPYFAKAKEMAPGAYHGGELTGEYGPLLVAPEVRGAQILAGGAAKFAPNIAKLAAKSPALAKRAAAFLADKGATGALYAPFLGLSEKEGAGGNILAAAALKGAGGAIGSAGRMAGNLLNPSQKLLERSMEYGAGKYTPQETAEFLKMADQPELGADALTGYEPLIERLQGDLRGVSPKVGKNTGALLKGLDEDASQFINNLRGKVPHGETEGALLEALKGSHNKHKTEVDRLYKDIHKDADAAGFNLKRNGEAAQYARDLIAENEAALASGNKDAALPKELLESAAARLEEGTPGVQNKMKPNTDSVKRLQDKARAADAAGESYVSKRYGELAEALDNDIQAELSQIGEGELGARYEQAKDYWHENYLPYKHKSIKGLLRGETAPDQIHSTLTQPGNNRETILKHLSPDAKKLVAYNYLRGIQKEGLAEGEKIASAAPLVRAMTRLSNQRPRVFEEIFNPAEQEAYRSIAARNERFAPLRTYQSRPPTGVQTKDLLNKVKTNLVPLLALGGVAVGSATSSPAMIASALGVAGVHRYLRKEEIKYLMSPKTKEQLVSGNISSRTYGALNKLTNAVRKVLAPEQSRRALTLASAVNQTPSLPPLDEQQTRPPYQ